MGLPSSELGKTANGARFRGKIRILKFEISIGHLSGGQLGRGIWSSEEMTGLEIFSDNWEGSASGENLKPKDWKGTPTKEGVQGLNLWL